jgi:hypothetical protein
MTISPTSIPEQPGKGLWSADALVAHRKACREAAESDQAARSEIIDGHLVRPAIGRTGRADNVGWEVHPPVGPPWFLATRDLAIAAIPRLRSRTA